MTDQPPQQAELAAFEHWFSDEGRSPQAALRGRDGYALMQAESAWLVWQAARATTVTQEPVAWIRFCSDGTYEGPVMDNQLEDVRRRSGAWSPLIIGAHSAPVTMREPVAWREHVEQRIRSWRQRTMNSSGDMLALDDFMGQDSIDDLVDFVCNEWANPAHPALDAAAIRAQALEEAAQVCEDVDPVTYRFGGETHDDSAGTRGACADAIRKLAKKGTT